MVSTVELGDSFRDGVIQLLEAADIRAVGEVRRNFKKVDIEATLQSRFDGSMTIIAEAKCYTGNVPKQECINFLHEYGTLMEGRNDVRAWLISRGAISPDGRALIEAKANMRCFTYAELQRWTLDLSRYTRALIDSYQDDQIESYFIPPVSTANEKLDQLVDAWLVDGSAPPLAVMGGYGIGKTTFAKHLANRLADVSVRDPSARTPILIPLSEVFDDQTIDGLIGKVLASKYVVPGYHYRLFEVLNRLGRFVIIFDGFDEMKHGMTPRGFERNVTEFMKLDRGYAKIIILGRDTAFHNDAEFNSIISGKRRTQTGTHAVDLHRRPFRPVNIRGFTLPEAKTYIKNYFPVVAARAAERSGVDLDIRWIETRKAELLSGTVDELLDRPVHAQMLCEIAIQPEVRLDGISRNELYNLFIHYLIEREVHKKGRYHLFDIAIRRRFNASLAWWLWERGGASTTTFADIPDSLCSRATEKIVHEFDELSIRRELVAGCLISKGGDTIYFAHRSIQEFLVAEYLVETDFAGSAAQNSEAPEKFRQCLQTLINEVVDFIVSGVIARGWKVDKLNIWFAQFSTIATELTIGLPALDLFTKLLCATGLGLDPWLSPWAFLIENFTRNGHAEFQIRDQHIQDACRLLDQALSRGDSHAYTAVFYWARCIRRDAGNSQKLSAALIARLMSPGALEVAMRQVNARAPAKVEIGPRLQPNLWLFLKSVQIEGAGTSSTRLTLDLNFLISHGSSATKLKVSEEVAAGSIQTFRQVAYCTVNDIVDASSSAGHSVGDTSTIQRFLTNVEYQQRIRASDLRPQVPANIVRPTRITAR